MGKNYLDHSDDVTSLEMRHEKLSLRAAMEGIVLLSNNGTLPLSPGPIALFGAGAGRTIIGGTGSGEVNCRRTISVMEGLLQEGFSVTTKDWIRRYEEVCLAGEKEYKRAFQRRLLLPTPDLFINIMKDPYRPPAGPKITRADVAGSGATAIYVLSRISGEGSDQKSGRGDFSLVEQEREHLQMLTAHYEKVVLVLNVGGIFDLSFLGQMPEIGAVVLLGQAGSMGGLALAKILKGESSPSGHLTDTWADRLTEYPSRKLGVRSGHIDIYKEDIFVGYRYFDTVGSQVRYPFGHGLSYTKFSVMSAPVKASDVIRIRFLVKNAGSRFSGAAALQVYAGLPEGRLEKERRRLVGFSKTRVLLPGEEEELSLTIPYENLASYDENTHAFVLEKGRYPLYAGESLGTAEAFAVLEMPEEYVVSRHGDALANARRMDFANLPKRAVDEPDLPAVRIPVEKIPVGSFGGRGKFRLSRRERSLLSRLSLNELVSLCVGSGMLAPKDGPAVPGAAGYAADGFGRRGIRAVAMADGPAGLRLERRVAIKPSGKLKSVDPYISFMRYLPGLVKWILMASPERYPLGYQHATAFPVGTSLAQTWNTALVEEVGRAAGREACRYGVSYWLAPGLNLHRDPLCGRNFEYYSEDPLLSGKIAAAVIRGAGSAGITAVPKHFACNNREDEREYADARVSERALRELYLRGFEIAVREGKPGAIMTSYNKINGKYAAESAGLLQGVLRGEWGFEGIVMSDWNATEPNMVNPARAVAAGNDLIMPGRPTDRARLANALRAGKLRRGALVLAAARVLRSVTEYTAKP
ncbi:MAG: glycoside hydrolase family 3 protein [bacterium]